MNKKEINTLMDNSEKYYADINAFESDGELPLLDIVYPAHDGVQDADVVSDLMMLCDRLNAIKNLCVMAVQHINNAITY